jgi:hypothetical protein
MAPPHHGSGGSLIVVFLPEIISFPNGSIHLNAGSNQIHFSQQFGWRQPCFPSRGRRVRLQPLGPCIDTMFVIIDDLLVRHVK